ncbi:hypothetical protein [Yoonia sp. 2307UL14-13]|uniref:hypothetical protein n=1 Tax=Yoonia sp. 2307UL14-13 TaxID=3126506 RepID=UPI00309F002F
MKHFMMTCAACLPLTATAQNFEEGSEARSWNLYAEIPARFEATVVDILCELTEDCPENCGDGNRQLGLVRSVDDVLVFPNKNSQPAFTGAVKELLPYCGQVVEVDGLLLEDEFVGAKNIYLVQTIRAAGEDEWVKANTWTKKWQEAHPEAAGGGPWFRRDPRILAEIAEEGYFGLGLEQDEEIKDFLFE